MIPFRVQFQPGGRLYEQVVYAAMKAVMSGQLQPGDPFPSVRTLSKALKINPNTAHKVVAYLVKTGLLETKQGVGTVVAVRPEASKRERAKLLEEEIEKLVVESRRLRIDLEDIVETVTEHWRRFTDKARAADDMERRGRAKQ